ncbi:hypothetical protein RYX36_001993 [Vicia faba]
MILLSLEGFALWLSASIKLGGVDCIGSSMSLCLIPNHGGFMNNECVSFTALFSINVISIPHHSLFSFGFWWFTFYQISFSLCESISLVPSLFSRRDLKFFKIRMRTCY